MSLDIKCESPDCDDWAKWFMGREFDTRSGPHSRGHAACHVHLAEGCIITLKQLLAEGETDARLEVRPILSVEALR
jgi:hypothetical protein